MKTVKIFETVNDIYRMTHRGEQRCRARLINTLLQRGVGAAEVVLSRFNGFNKVLETVETVCGLATATPTPLKRGINERNYICAAIR